MLPGVFGDLQELLVGSPVQPLEDMARHVPVCRIVIKGLGHMTQRTRVELRSLDYCCAKNFGAALPDDVPVSDCIAALLGMVVHDTPRITVEAAVLADKRFLAELSEHGECDLLTADSERLHLN
ncbi:hypothetical protein DIZ27_41315 [Streptomyces sp. NWU339]|nr:hypothetical protein DIZ27_41315 [Streptomyces sp. NWU339]